MVCRHSGTGSDVGISVGSWESLITTGTYLVRFFRRLMSSITQQSSSPTRASKWRSRCRMDRRTSLRVVAEEYITAAFVFGVIFRLYPNDLTRTLGMYASRCFLLIGTSNSTMG